MADDDAALIIIVQESGESSVYFLTDIAKRDAVAALRELAGHIELDAMDEEEEL